MYYYHTASISAPLACNLTIISEVTVNLSNVLSQFYIFHTRHIV